MATSWSSMLTAAARSIGNCREEPAGSSRDESLIENLVSRLNKGRRRFPALRRLIGCSGACLAHQAGQSNGALCRCHISPANNGKICVANTHRAHDEQKPPYGLFER